MACNYTSGRLEFHDRRARPSIMEPMRSLAARSLLRSRGRVRDFSSRVIFRESAARVGMCADTQASTKGYVYLSTYGRDIFPPFSPSFSFFLAFVL